MRSPTCWVICAGLPGEWCGCRIIWTGLALATYDLDRPSRLASMYKTVLNEASNVADLRTWLNAEVLIGLWPTLWLPPRLRQMWERKFPELVAARVSAA